MHTPNESRRARAEAPSGSAARALALASLLGALGLFGAGHFVLARWRRGAAWLLVGLTTLALPRAGAVVALPPRVRASMIVVGLALFALQAVDAYCLAGGDLRVAPLSDHARALGSVGVLSLGLVPLPTLAPFAYRFLIGHHEMPLVATYALSSWLTLGILLLLARAAGARPGSLGWACPNVADLGWGALACFLAWTAAIEAAAYVNLLLGNVRPLKPFSVQPFAQAIYLVSEVVTASLVEETLFRGFPIAYLRARGLAPLPAAALSLVAFALMHAPTQGPGGVVLTFFWGILPTVLYLARGNLGASWVMHAMSNALTSNVIPLLSR